MNKDIIMDESVTRDQIETTVYQYQANLYISDNINIQGPKYMRHFFFFSMLKVAAFIEFVAISL